jgi:hypothetical protein
MARHVVHVWRLAVGQRGWPHKKVLKLILGTGIWVNLALLVFELFQKIALAYTLGPELAGLYKAHTGIK